jgi:hypothetical protein
MRITLPQLDVPDLLDLGHVIPDEDTSGVTLEA